MKVKEYIKKTMGKLITTFDNIKCSYRFDAFTKTHYIEILPNDFFETSDELSLLRADIFDEFDEVFPTQSIVFISENSLTKLGKANYSIEGNKYIKIQPFDIAWLKKFSFVSTDVEPVLASSENNYALAA